jgi:hypothetical protein
MVVVVDLKINYKRSGFSNDGGKYTLQVTGNTLLF